ncbi:hypothetical protein FRX31_021658, partial [Thalictrum thalictroides]
TYGQAKEGSKKELVDGKERLLEPIKLKFAFTKALHNNFNNGCLDALFKRGRIYSMISKGRIQKCSTKPNWPKVVSWGLPTCLDNGMFCDKCEACIRPLQVEIH